MSTQAKRTSTLCRFELTLAAASFALCVVRASAASLAYIPAGNGVLVIDTATSTVTTTIPTSAYAAEIAITPDGKFAYLANAGSGAAGNVEVIATATNTTVANIPVGSGPRAIAAAPNGQSVYVLNTYGNSVSVIATSTNSVVAQIPVATTPNSKMVLPADGSSVYVTNFDSNTVSVIDTATNTVSNTIEVAAPYDIAASPSGPVFVSSFRGAVSVIDIATSTIVATIPVTYITTGLAVSPNSAFLYTDWITPGSSGVSVIEISSYTELATIPGALSDRPDDMSFSPDGAFLYISSPINSTVSVLSTANYALVNKIAVPGSPGTTAFTPLSNAVVEPALVTVHPASVAGGTSAIGYVVLNGAAPGGATVSLSTSDASVTVPATVTVPAGGKASSFSVTTQAVSASQSVTVSAVYNTLSKSADLTVIPIADVAISSVSIHPTAILGGNSTAGTVTLNVPAPAGGVTVELWTNGSPAFVPEAVTIPAGSAAAAFTVTTNAVATTTQGTITAFLNGTTTTATVTVTAPPAVASVLVKPWILPNNVSSSGTVTLSGPAPTGGTTVQLWTSGSPVFVPASVTVPAGSTAATFAVTTSYVTATTDGTVTAFLNGQSVTSNTVTVTASGTLASIVVNPVNQQSNIPTSSTALVTVSLTSLAPAGGTVVDLWTNGSPLFVPASVSIPAGSTSGSFYVTTSYVATTTQGTITAFLNGQTVTTTVTVTPAALASVAMNSATALGGLPVSGTLTLVGPAPTGGLVIQLWTNGSPAYAVPATVTIPAGYIQTSFELQTDTVNSPRASTVTASLNGQNVTTTFTVMPPIALASVSVSPASVEAYGSAIATVTLAAPLPANVGSIVIQLWTNGSPAFVPNAAIVTAGSDTITFPVTTNYVATSTQGTITAYFNGQSVATTITVAP